MWLVGQLIRLKKTVGERYEELTKGIVVLPKFGIVVAISGRKLRVLVSDGRDEWLETYKVEET